LELALEASLLVLSPRFVGVPPEVMEATVITFIAHRSPANASELVAGLIVWWVCVQLVPMVFGAGLVAAAAPRGGRAGVLTS